MRRSRLGNVESVGKHPGREWHDSEKDALRKFVAAFFPVPDRTCEFCGCHVLVHSTTIKPTSLDMMFYNFGLVTEEHMHWRVTMVDCMVCAGRLRTEQVVCWKRKEEDDGNGDD